MMRSRRDRVPLREAVEHVRDVGPALEIMGLQNIVSVSRLMTNGMYVRFVPETTLPIDRRTADLVMSRLPFSAVHDQPENVGVVRDC